MGNNQYRQREHKVTISPFKMMDAEVTNAQFDLFNSDKRAFVSGGENTPVSGRSRSDVLKYIEWLSKRDKVKYQLPTEAQWEYACRGGLEGKDYPWGNQEDTSRAAMEGYNMVDVRSYTPNGFGLYDMAGNAAEMVYEEPYDYTDQPVKDPKYKLGTASFIARGGATNDLYHQTWYRAICYSDIDEPRVGFRLVILE